MNPQHLPQTDSIEELAKFWDAHDVTDFDEELVEVEEPVFQREASIALRLPATEADAVRNLAKSKGLADSELIRQWVLEKIHSL